jgi:hypothetical protein
VTTTVEKVHSTQKGDPTEDPIRSLRTLVLAGEQYRQALSRSVGLGETETQAVST